MVQTMSRLLAASRITAASIPNGAEKNSVESSVASATTPSGVANRRRTQREKAPILGRFVESKANAKRRGRARLGIWGEQNRRVKCALHQTLSEAPCCSRSAISSFAASCLGALAVALE